ncbi:hypothetical protein [Maribellus sediminis]|uniref:hypothetical protein n=1 Tax=Maribellus sediminis TaxID=2696285 RepID=UPI001431F3EC|nr:hypothetical protein [Maribellus sediminis]
MKAFKLIAALFVISILTTAVSAEEKTKEYNESWPVSEVSSLEISNKFGEVRVNNDGGSEVTIDVKITVEAANEKKAEELLDMIEVNFSKSGSTVKAVTEIENNFKSQKKFSIDYIVNIPSDKNLMIENKYGNTVVNSLTGNGNFDIKYGNFTANELKTPESGDLKLDLKYGNGTIGEASFLVAEVGYSPLTIEEIKALDLESKYSTIEVEEAGDLQIESKYDKLSFEEVNSVTANTKYSNMKIGELAKSLRIESGYGGVQVGQVNEGFEFITITNSYGQISLGLDDSSYDVDANCRYCGISYPEDSFTGDRIKENNTYQLTGKVGSGNGGKVNIKSQYGEIKLKD